MTIDSTRWLQSLQFQDGVADIVGDSRGTPDLVSVPGFYANGSYNDATGWGTVDAASFVPALARFAG
jgi:hypothetical protein